MESTNKVNTIKNLIEKEPKDYKILEKFIPEYLGLDAAAPDYSIIQKFLDDYKITKGKEQLKKEEDIFLGQIIYSYNLLKKIFEDNLPQTKEFTDLEKAYEQTKLVFILYSIDFVNRYVYPFIKKGVKNGLTKEDLVQEGLRKIIEVIDKYDYRFNCKFNTYSSQWLRSCFDNAISGSRIIKIPNHTMCQINKVKIEKDKLAKTLQREPTDEEIAIVCKTSVERINHLLNDSQEIVYYQSVNKDNELTYENLISDRNDIEDFVCNGSVKEALKKAMESLTEREKKVIILRFGLETGTPLTLEEVGNVLGITRERVRQIEGKALRVLRHPENSKYIKDYYI